MLNLAEATRNLEGFQGGSLTDRIAEIEWDLRGKNNQECEDALSSLGVSRTLLESAYALKSVAGQINVVIHAIGILLLLPHILREGEAVEGLSLGAGNTGREFDLETNLRIAEFKFIQWQGGPESLRKKSLFKDFYELAEYDTPKARYLYLTETARPLRFLRGGSAISNVLDRNVRLRDDFQQKYQGRFITVRQYYEYRSQLVSIQSMASLIPPAPKVPDDAPPDDI
jgi:hypothetical protein